MEDEFMGTAKLAKLDRKIQELRDKVDESSDESCDDSGQQSSISNQSSRSNKTSKNSSKNNKSDKSKYSARSREIIVPLEFKELQRQASFIQPIRQNNIADQGSLMTLNSSQIQKNDPLSGKLLKIDLIDDIEELRQQLQEERINTDYLPKYNENSELATLKNIKHILLRKVRKQQSSSIVEDLLFMVLKGIESVFNGETSVAGMRPNLKGLTKSVSLKMRNQKQQFSEAIESFCQSRGISQNSKLLVQIGISAVKRNFLNKDQSQTEDRSEDLLLLQQMYKNNNQ